MAILSHMVRGNSLRVFKKCEGIVKRVLACAPIKNSNRPWPGVERNRFRAQL